MGEWTEAGGGLNRENKIMDQDTYEQLMRVQISLDELKEKMDLMIDEIDELKNITKKDQDSGQKQDQEKDQHSAEQSCGNPQTEEQQNQTHHTL